jgi:hypothetical protein
LRTASLAATDVVVAAASAADVFGFISTQNAASDSGIAGVAAAAAADNDDDAGDGDGLREEEGGGKEEEEEDTSAAAAVSSLPINRSSFLDPRKCQWTGYDLAGLQLLMMSAAAKEDGMVRRTRPARTILGAQLRFWVCCEWYRRYCMVCGSKDLPRGWMHRGVRETRAV